MSDSVPDSQGGERIVRRVGHALAVVPSLRAASGAWTRLGFTVSKRFEFLGCPAFDVVLAGGGIRFLAPVVRGPQSTLSEVVRGRLVGGAGLLGWTWACDDLRSSRQAIESRSGVEFACDGSGGKSTVVPSELNPGAVTLLEESQDDELPVHHNAITELDHLVVMMSHVDAAAGAYEKHFGLRAKLTAMQERRYAFLKVGGSVIEIVGPLEPERGPITGKPWGLAMRSHDLDATVANLRRAGVQLPDPHPAIQGGRLTSLPMQLGGIHIAFIGD
jgi:predicted enzyme related to lactoylglutathione lyase